MFAPNQKWERQKNIIQDRFQNLNPEGTPWQHRLGDNPLDNPKIVEQHTRLRLWKLLREVDVPPVFLLHLEEELYSLVKRKLEKSHSACVKKCHYHRMKEMVEKIICNCEQVS